MKVLGRVTSINVRKVLWALDELALPYEREDWGLPLRDPKVPEFLALNPNGQVPVIRDGDVTLWESTAILIYIADRYGTGLLLPTDHSRRGQALQWLVWQATELNPTWGYAVNARIRNTPGYDDPAKVRESIARWAAKMQILEEHMAVDREFVDGAFSVADIALGLSLHRWYAVPEVKPDFPAVSAYYMRLKERPAGATWMGAETP
ncbi:glutathione S-transferase family protein [Devosia albogilva]|uniref:Glutathione S-transferase family protein n=1 Tax=Devosia albogilva TaxID=429726 RepID=A0ABW5QHK6_9HYPH